MQGPPWRGLLAGASGSSLLAGAGGSLVKELLTTALVLLAGASAGASVLLGEELLEASGLLAGTSDVLIEELLTTALVLLLPFLLWKGGHDLAHQLPERIDPSRICHDHGFQR